MSKVHIYMIVLGVSLSLGLPDVVEAKSPLTKRQRVAWKIKSKVRRARVKLHRYLQPRLRPSPGILPKNATRGVWPALRKATGATDNLRRKVSYKLESWANHLQREKRTVDEYRQRYKGEQDKVNGIVRIGKYSFKRPNAPQPAISEASHAYNNLDGAAQNLWQQAKRTSRPAAMLFNNVALIAKPGDRSPKTALKRYYKREGRVYGSSRQAAYWLGKLGRTLAPPMY